MSDEEAIKTQREKHVENFNNGDLSAASEQVCEDTAAMPPNQPLLTGKSSWENWLKEGFDAASTKMDIVSRELVIAGDVAYDELQWSQEITPKGGGEPSRDGGHGIWMWRKDPDGEWRIWRAIWNSDGDTQNIWSGASRE